MSDVPVRPELLPADEAHRLAALQRTELLDTPPEADFDLLAEVAAQLCQVPYAFISLVDADRVWYKACFGKRVCQNPRNDDYCSWAILEDRLLVLPDLPADVRSADISLTKSGTKYRMYAAANLITADGYRIGTLCVLDTKSGQLTAEQERLLVGLAGQVMALIELRKRNAELGEALARLEKIAAEDMLTGLRSRRSLIEGMVLEIERAQRFDSPVSVMLLDIDHFKKINDDFDHAMGDAVLQGIGSLLQNSIRSIDIAGRYGGEELCLVLPGTDRAGALSLAEKIRLDVAATLFEDNGRQARITASFGVATLLSHQPRTPDQLVRAADSALYKAKHQGRNRVVAEDEPLPIPLE